MQAFVFFDIEISGAGGIRTLVQTWYKVSFLHAYLLLGCREGEGQPLTCTVFRRCFISPAYHTSKQASFIFRCPGCRSNETENRRDKGYANSKLGSQGVVIFAICKFERSDLSANSPNALHAYLLISILSIPVDPIFVSGQF